MTTVGAATGGAGTPPGPEARHPSTQDVAALVAALGTDVGRGLATAEAAARLRRDGPNRLRALPRVPWWRRLAAQLRDPLVTLLLVAAGVATLAWLVEGAEGVPVDAVVVLAIVLADAVLGLVQERRAESAVALLQAMTAPVATVLRDGRPVVVDAETLVVGDVLVLAAGDAVGADARVVAATGLRVAEAALTGESEPVPKAPEPLGDLLPVGDRTAMVHSGTAVVQGSGRAVVTAVGMATEMGAIADLLDRTEEDPAPLEREMAAVGRVLGRSAAVVALVVVAATALVNRVSTPGEWVTVLLLGISLAVAAVPEGLPAVLSVVLAVGVRRMAARDALVKAPAAVQALGAASVVATDKTGTLTAGQMTVREVRVPSGRAAVTGTGYDPVGGLTSGGVALRDGPVLEETALLLHAGAAAGDARLVREAGTWGVVGDPTEGAIVVAARKVPHARTAGGPADLLGAVVGGERVGEVPFTSARKRMSVLLRAPDGTHLLVVKGAPDVLLPLCAAVRVAGCDLPLDDAGRARLRDEAQAVAALGLRGLAVAYRPAAPDEVTGLDEDAEHDLVHLGLVGMADPPRPEAGPAVAEARRSGIRVVMITGDHPATARTVAAELGILGAGGDGAVVTGAQLDATGDAELDELVRSTTVYARVAPGHKLRIVDALQAGGEVVAMTGDGVNDAPALRAADVGIAMGRSGTEVTRQAARMVLRDDDFATIVAAVREGRQILDNVVKFLRYLLTSNTGEVLTVLVGVLLAGRLGLVPGPGEAVALPLLATQVLWVNLVTDSAPALAMGVDPPTDDVMARPPRRPGARVLDRALGLTILSTGAVVAVLTLVALDAQLPGGLVPGSGTVDEARTAAFTTLVLAQLVAAFCARSGTRSAFASMARATWLWAAVALSAALQVAVVHVPLLQHAFGTVALTPAQWATAAGLASGVLWFDEARKAVLRAAGRRRARAARRG